MPLSAPPPHRFQGWVTIAVLLALVLLVSAHGPAEQTLGEGVRIVYLHGAMVWTALILLAMSAVAGLAAGLRDAAGLKSWSIGLARAGMTTWVAYLPVSLIAMDLNWNGSYLSEPRWSSAVNIAIAGVLVQIGVSFLMERRLVGLVNAGFTVGVFYLISSADQVLHPVSPIFGSSARSIQVFTLALLLLCCLAGLHLANLIRPSRWRTG